MAERAGCKGEGSPVPFLQDYHPKKLGLEVFTYALVYEKDGGAHGILATASGKSFYWKEPELTISLLTQPPITYPHLPTPPPQNQQSLPDTLPATFLNISKSTQEKKA